jgi:hypothetical protein
MGSYRLACAVALVFAGTTVIGARGEDPPLQKKSSAAPASTSVPQKSKAAARAEDDEPPLAPPAPGAARAGAADKSGELNLRDYGISGSLRGALWSSNRRLDNEHGVGVASAWLKFDRKLNKAWGVFAEGYLSAENIFDESKSTNRLREAYAEARFGQWDFRLGKQIIAWGRADRLNPTDNLTPRDFTLLAPEIDEDRFGSLAAKAMWNFTPHTSLTAVWIPEFRPHVFAVNEAPGLAIRENIPGGSNQWAMKLDQSGKDIDWSVSYFEGYDLNADLRLVSATPVLTQIALDHNRVKVLGFDAATSRGAYRFALEAAYTRTDDPHGRDPYVKNPFFYGVFGVERTFGDNLTLINQFFWRKVEHYNDPADQSDPVVRAVAQQQGIANLQYDRQTYGLSTRIGKKWWNETLEGELAGAVLLSRTGYLLRPKLTYAYSDALKLIGGYEYYGGSDKTSYGRLAPNKALFLEARYFF